MPKLFRLGLGMFVRLVSLEPDDRVLRKADLVGLLGVARGLGERRVSEDRHDHLRSGARLSEAPARRLAQSVRLARKRQSSLIDRAPHPAAEASARPKMR